MEAKAKTRSLNGGESSIDVPAAFPNDAGTFLLQVDPCGKSQFSWKQSLAQKIVRRAARSGGKPTFPTLSSLELSYAPNQESLSTLLESEQSRNLRVGKAGSPPLLCTTETILVQSLEAEKTLDFDYTPSSPSPAWNHSDFQANISNTKS